VLSDGRIVLIRQYRYPVKKFTLEIPAGKLAANESPLHCIKRELREETGLIASRILSLNWGSVYLWRGEEFKEMNFLSFVNEDKVILNEEYSNYKWVDLEEFIKEINWEDNKRLLKKVIEKAIKEEIFFNKKEREQ